MASTSSRTQTNLNIFTTLQVTLNRILEDTVSYLQTTFKQSSLIFTLASPFGQVLLVLENLSQLIFYYIEDSTTEQNINEASRPSSVYSLASLAGHNPSRAIGAQGEVVLQTITGATDVPANAVTINNYFRLQCTNNGLTYSIVLPSDTLTFNLSGVNNNMRFAIKQGTAETQNFQATGEAFFSCQVGYPNNFLIDNFLVNAYVNGVQWNKYDSLLDMPLNAKGFITKTGVINGLDVYFGNGSMGAIPAAGNVITVEYFTVNGAAGNIAVDDPTQIQFTFLDTAVDSLGNEVNLNDFLTLLVTSAPNFGSDAEPLALTRLIAPHASRNFALVNAESYEIFLAKMQLFSTIRVTIDPTNPLMLDLFLIPDITKLFTTGASYFQVPEENFVLSTAQQNQLLQYIYQQGTMVISTDIKIINPTLTSYVLNVSVIIFEDSTETYQSDIINAVGTYFERISRTNLIPKSDLISAIAALNSIDSVSINILSEANEISKSANPSAADIGVDRYNNIVVQPDELPIIRGGWTDRFGNQYVLGLPSQGQLGALNIQLAGTNVRDSNLTAFNNTN